MTHIILAFLIVSSMTFTGCSLSRSIDSWYSEWSGERILRGVTALDSKLKNRICFAYIENKTLYDSQKLQASFIPELEKAISRSFKDILIVKPAVAEVALQPETVSATGQIDNIQIARTGQAAGINAIIICRLSSITSDKKKRGVWGLRKIKNYAEMHMIIDIYDTETGSKISEDVISGSVFVNDAETGLIQSGNIENMTLLDKALNGILENACEKIGEAVRLQPWKGFITSISGNMVTVSSGSASGLKPGDILDVYNSGKTIEGKNTHKYFLPGNQSTGRLVVRSVSPGSSQAEIISGDVQNPGSCVFYPGDNQPSPKICLFM